MAKNVAQLLVVMDCDTLLMLGTDFPYQQFYPQHATVVQVDIRAEQIGRRTKVDRAESPEEIRPAFAHPGPALIDVVVNRQELSMPPTVTMAQALGFNLYLLKAVINGKGDEIIDLAKTNLFR